MGYIKSIAPVKTGESDQNDQTDQAAPPEPADTTGN
jgi:hypothetical protein